MSIRKNRASMENEDVILSPELYNYPGFKINIDIARDVTSTMV
jgi:hypothetical protein